MKVRPDWRNKTQFLPSSSCVDTATWMLTRHMEKKFDGNYTRMLQAILNKSWRQHPTKQQLYGHLPPIMKTIKIRRTRHAGRYLRRMDEIIIDVLLWTPSQQRQDDQLEPTYSSSVLIQDVALKTCWKQWTIGRGGKRGLGISVLMVRRVDDVIYLYHYCSHHGFINII